MTNTNATNLRKNLFSYLDSTIEYNDIINVNTKNVDIIIVKLIIRKNKNLLKGIAKSKTI